MCGTIGGTDRERIHYGLLTAHPHKPTVLELGARIAEIEGAHHRFVVPEGHGSEIPIILPLQGRESMALVPIHRLRQTVSGREDCEEPWFNFSGSVEQMIGSGMRI